MKKIIILVPFFCLTILGQYKEDKKPEFAPNKLLENIKFSQLTPNELTPKKVEELRTVGKLEKIKKNKQVIAPHAIKVGTQLN